MFRSYEEQLSALMVYRVSGNGATNTQESGSTW